ncbi:type VII toxin-antitoxin system MntA family adenylyltransferase antitoxin [Clostridium neonatale]|uniref:type VII toxin-antitoxin system MntA family adenylyltransferase antitoxin n=1 Tax=Clostridium neonatale TaxID=137838 RepID=UPI00291B7F7C|nr:Predicted nucleotidyltransferases [Clostridium neonatale]
MMGNRHEIIKKLYSEELKEYLNKINIKSAIVFGSIITEEFNDESDVDIAILGDSLIDMKTILKLELFLEDLLGRPIDVIDLKSSSLDIFIKIDALNTGVSIYTSDEGKYLEIFKESVDWYYRENEYYFECRKRDLLS